MTVNCINREGSSINQLVNDLNHPERNIRLASLHQLVCKVNTGELCKYKPGRNVNNHIHTIYSFSPYSPAKTVWLSYCSSLAAAGIMDHDSISGAHEFIEAGNSIGLATTIGVECRADFSQTELAGRRINHPDQKSVAYIALHGIPHNQIENVKKFFYPILQKRNERNQLMVDQLNQILIPFGFEIDFNNDVIPISMHNEQGSITERHILFVLAKKLVGRFGRGKELISFLTNELKLSIPSRVQIYLEDDHNEFYEYDLLGALRSDLVPAFYIEANEECPDVRKLVVFSREIGAILAYCYLGDITESVTGDKKRQKFEDDYLDLLFDTIIQLGFHAVTYMPSRNSSIQLKRIKKLCTSYNLFQISGEDINSPRQSFICDALRKNEFKNLIDSTWALIGHEKKASLDINKGMFSQESIERFPDLHARIENFMRIGKEFS